MTENENSCPVRMLFDLSFTEFVTTRVIKVLFVIGIVLAGLAAIALVVRGFHIGIWRGIFHLLLSPIVFLLYVLLARVWCELIIVIFRIAENTGKLVAQQKS